MALQLYKVDVTFSFYILAENLNDGYHTSIGIWDEVCKDTSAAAASNVDVATSVDFEWRDSLPYCNRGVNPDEKTCAELFKELNQ